MRWMCWLLIPVLAAFGGESSFPDTENVADAMKELENTPVAVEAKRIRDEMDKMEVENSKKVEPLRTKLSAICDTKEYIAYEEKRAELDARRRDAWEIERKAMVEETRKLYAARHEEIKSIARVDLPEARKLGLSILTYPRVDGSTSTGPLSVVMASRILNVPYEWIYPEPTGFPWARPPDVSEYFLPEDYDYYGREYEFLLATLKVVAKPAKVEQERTARLINSVIAASTSTHAAYVNVIQGKSDLNLAARPPSESELKLAKEKGVKIVCEPVARDALVFMVHRDNPIKSLTREQVRAIYEQKLKTWKEVGGGEGDISAYRRERDSGSRELFDALVMNGTAITEGESFMYLYSSMMGGPFTQLTRDKKGIGYSIYYYDHFMAASAYTRAIPIDGVEPTAGNIASGKYPWVTHVYIVYRGGMAEDSSSMKLVKWMISDEGQAVVRESGYVPRKPPVQAAENMKN